MARTGNASRKPMRTRVRHLASIAAAALLAAGCATGFSDASFTAASANTGGTGLKAARVFASAGTARPLVPHSVADQADGSSANTSDTWAYADGTTANTGNASASYASNRYVDFQLESPLPAGVPLTAASFDFTFAATGASHTACFYVEVRRTSSGQVLGTEGSPTADTCVSGQTVALKSTSIATEVTNGTIADDLTIRAYVKESGSRGVKIDAA